MSNKLNFDTNTERKIFYCSEKYEVKVYVDSNGFYKSSFCENKVSSEEITLGFGKNMIEAIENSCNNYQKKRKIKNYEPQEIAVELKTIFDSFQE